MARDQDSDSSRDMVCSWTAVARTTQCSWSAGPAHGRAFVAAARVNECSSFAAACSYVFSYHSSMLASVVPCRQSLLSCMGRHKSERWWSPVQQARQAPLALLAFQLCSLIEAVMFSDGCSPAMLHSCPKRCRMIGKVYTTWKIRHVTLLMMPQAIMGVYLPVLCPPNSR
eukprot:1160224-Pelagomonas_calceolata.AAC.1